MEEGIRCHAVSAYDSDDYFFEESQFLTKDFIYDINEDVKHYQDKLKTKKDHEDKPRILSHILEQNFLEKTKNDNVRLGGVSFGIALKSVYRFQTEEGGHYYEEPISESEAIKKDEDIEY